MNDRIIQDVSSLLRARNPIIWVSTTEEARAEQSLAIAAGKAGFIPHTWDVAQGARELDNSRTPQTNEDARDPGVMLTIIEKRQTSRDVWIMRDLPPWLEAQAGVSTRRQLRNLARTLPGFPRDKAQAIIILSPETTIPRDLSNHVTAIEWPLPTREEIAQILDDALDSLPEDIKQGATLTNGRRDEAIDAAVGLTAEEAASCYARSLVQLKRIDPAIVANEKKRVIARERILEWFDPLPGGLDAVGGLDELKQWLKERSTAYSQKAKDYGLPPPKGALLVGVPGCGKSLTAKAVATAWSIPLLRLDLGAIKSKFVGESEANLRRAFRVIESVGRCVVWLDEVEKALQGATSGSADGGVSSDALGAILSWMQDRRGEAFIIATSNDVSALPPELLRKGRFDEIWFIDLPTPREREAVLEATLRQFKNTPKSTLDITRISVACQNFTGSEVAAIVPDAMFQSFNEDRPLTTEDLIKAAARVVPLAKTGAEKITSLRTWAKERARPASTPAEESPVTRIRALDV